MAGESMRNSALAKIEALVEEHKLLLANTISAPEAQMRQWQGMIRGLLLAADQIDLAYRENN